MSTTTRFAIVALLIFLGAISTYYLSESILLVALLIFFGVAVFMTIAHLIGKRSPNVDLKKIWKEFLNALSGMT